MKSRNLEKKQQEQGGEIGLDKKSHHTYRKEYEVQIRIGEDRHQMPKTKFHFCIFKKKINKKFPYNTKKKEREGIVHIEDQNKKHAALDKYTQ